MIYNNLIKGIILEELLREYCYKAVEEHKYTGVAVSKLLGIDASAVSWVVKKYLESKYR